MKIYDLIVIGAGPAGSSAGREAGELGLNVLMIDCYEFPRDKPCAGGLSTAAYRELDEELPPDLIEGKCYGMRSMYRGRVHVTRTETPTAYMIRRSTFDHYLLEKAQEAGALFLTEKVRKIRETSGLVEVETDRGTHYSRFLIGADGYFSVTAKVVRSPFSPKETRFCLISRPRGADHPVREGDKPLVELDFGFINKGYGWLFPKKDFLSAGMGGDFIEGRELKERYRTFLETHNLESDVKPKGCFIPVSNLKHRINTNRIMLTGDAAGLVDSFSGEGIRNAIISGRIAAAKARQSLKRKESLKGYRKEIMNRIGSDLFWSERMTRLSNRFEGLVYGKLLVSDRVMNRYFDILKGERSYRSFFMRTALELPFILLKGMFRRRKT
jgi:geranylgeranyl reductase family protein